ncbi:DUF6463 family protein [Nonomuraea sp. NPDC050404]|uniref:DUF6463 family protein n=1 Tax=Nonomuraea sp. NPDC050404 TaxID=3155783 RepID=UPI0033D1372C
MSSETTGSVKSVVWAGGILLVLGAAHVVLSGVLSAAHIPGWWQGGLWNVRIAALMSPEPAMGAFWLVWGSFGVPLALIGALVVGFGRRGQAPPVYLGVGVLVWALVGAALFEPSPFVVGAIPGVLMLAATRKSRTARAGAPTYGPSGSA